MSQESEQHGIAYIDPKSGELAYFDPSRHLVQIRRTIKLPDGRSDTIFVNYFKVAGRLVLLRKAHPEATVFTECVMHDSTHAIFKALVTLPSGAAATGWGSETQGDFRDFFEKAETKALGRALVALGLAAEYVDDYEADAPPIERRGETRSGQPEPVTESGNGEVVQMLAGAALGQVREIVSRARLSPAELDEVFVNLFGEADTNGVVWDKKLDVRLGQLTRDQGFKLYKQYGSAPATN